MAANAWQYWERALALVLGLVLSLATALRSEPAPMMPVGDVRDGMTGYGLTVFHGTKIDTFQVEVLAVLRHDGGVGDAIIARVSGGPLGETGVAQGMSGSPVYVDGKVIGAVAWTSTFTKIPLAGITPIEYMLNIPDRSLGQPAPGRYTYAPPAPTEDQTSPDWDAGYRHISLRERPPTLPPTWSANPVLSGAAGMEMVPIETPVAVTGADPRTFGFLEGMLSPYGMRVVQGGTMSADSLAGARLEPGASLGVTMMQGDMTISGVGTVTWVDGGTVVGFGHPMFYKGHLDFPLSLAYVHFLWPSQYISYKVTSNGPVVGSLRQDRRFGVAGITNEIPEMLPVEVSISGGPRPHAVRYEVVRDVDLGPQLVTYGLLASLYELEGLVLPSSVEMTQTIEIEGHEPIRKRNFYSDFGGLADAAMAAVKPLQTLVRNPFQPVKINRVAYEVAFQEEINAAFVRGLEISRRVVRPGEPLIVKTRLQTYLGDEFVTTTELPIADDVPDGIYLLRVGDATSAEKWMTEREPGRFIPDNLDHLIGLLNYEERNDQLTLEVVNKELGMTVENQALPSLPHTVFQMMRHAVPGGRIGPIYGNLVVRKQVPMNLRVLGSQEISVAVYRFARPR